MGSRRDAGSTEPTQGTRPQTRHAPALRLASIQASILGRRNEAIDLTNKAIERDPLRPNSYSNLGLAWLAVNRDTEAETAFRKGPD